MNIKDLTKITKIEYFYIQMIEFLYFIVNTLRL